MRKWVFAIVIILVIVGGLFLLGSNKSAAPQSIQTTQPTTQTSNAQPTQDKNTVTLTADGWSPSTLTVKAGSTVTWVNNEEVEATVNSDPHPVHTDYPPLNLGQFAKGQKLTLKFDKAGTYGYHNHLSPGQKGTIIVQ